MLFRSTAPGKVPSSLQLNSANILASLPAGFFSASSSCLLFRPALFLLGTLLSGQNVSTCGPAGRCRRPNVVVSFLSHGPHDPKPRYGAHHIRALIGGD